AGAGSSNGFADLLSTAAVFTGSGGFTGSTGLGATTGAATALGVSVVLAAGLCSSAFSVDFFSSVPLCSSPGATIGFAAGSVGLAFGPSGTIEGSPAVGTGASPVALLASGVAPSAFTASGLVPAIPFVESVPVAGAVSVSAAGAVPTSFSCS